VTEVGESEIDARVAAVSVSVAVLAPPRFPVIVTRLVAETPAVVMLNVAEVAPEGTVTDVGTVALVLLEESVTTAPPVPAWPLRVTVPVEEFPPITDVGDTDTVERAAGVMVNVATWLAPLSVAVICAAVDEETPVVVTVNVVVLDPAGIVTELGTVALALFDLSAIAKPPVGAGPLRVNVPVEGFPPTTDVGERLSGVRLGASIVKVAVGLLPPSVAVIVAAVLVATAVVFTVNSVVLAPAGTVTLAGTVAEPLLELKLTLIPPVGALPLKVTVPAEAVPPVTVVGETDTL
jgi:hypothetical protein